MFERWQAKRQWHRVCAHEVARLAQERDRVESKLVRLQQLYNDLLKSHKELYEDVLRIYKEKDEMAKKVGAADDRP